MKRKEENRSVIEPSCTFFKPSKINFLPSNRVLDRKPDRVTGYKVLIDLTSLIIIYTKYHQNNEKCSDVVFNSTTQLQARSSFTLNYRLGAVLHSTTG